VLAFLMGAPFLQAMKAAAAAEAAAAAPPEEELAADELDDL
jgi:hypothetical protein